MAQFDTPVGIACDAAGNLIVADSFNNVIRVGTPTSAPAGGGSSPAPSNSLGPTIVAQPSSQSVAAGSSASFAVAASGASLAYQWTLNGTSIAGATAASYSLDSAQVADSGSCAVTVADAGGSVQSQAAFLTVNGAGGPAIASQPQSFTTVAGGTVVFSVGASTGPASNAMSVRVAVSPGSLTYQWYFDGSELADGRGVNGSGSATLMVGGGAAKSGSYVCVVSNAMGSVASREASLVVSQTTNPGRLVNLSARADIGTGSNILIAGFTSGGAGTLGREPVLVRGIGPALSGFGVSGALADPELTLFQGSSAMTANAGWNGDTRIAQTDAAVGAFVLSDPSSTDSAILESGLVKGTYTAQVSGKSGDSGVGLVEVYDATASGAYRPTSPRLINLSARALVGSGSHAVIAGFVIGGSTAKTVLIRASGPALAALGLAGTLADPKLDLFAGSVVIASNSGWAGNPQVASASAASGAFAWTDPMSADSAILVTLEPGAYTAEVSGLSGGSGVALVEIYDLP